MVNEISKSKVPITDDQKHKIKSSIDHFTKKVTKIFITDGGGVVTQNVLDANLIKYLLKSDFNTKVKEIEDKIHDISSLVNKTQLTTVENTVVKKQILVLN